MVHFQPIRNKARKPLIWNQYMMILYLCLVLIVDVRSLSPRTLLSPRQFISLVDPWGEFFEEEYQNTAFFIYESGVGVERPMTRLPTLRKGYRRIAIISDTHGKHRKLKIPPSCDVLCHCGDIFQRYGTNNADGEIFLRDFADWLKEVDVPSVIIGGNHDVILEKLGDEKVRTIFSNSGASYLRDGMVNVAGLTFYGSPWSPTGRTRNKAFQNGIDAREEAAKAVDYTAERYIDVLLTHARDDRWETLVAASKVKLWAHGHWHNERGDIRVIPGGCVSVNAASHDLMYRNRHPPVVFDVPIRN
mmetsp:Transcript_3668/g.5287  ORF Transcript_3668/g.5287 Transcript_3668/m.5287 type:complete len:303 (-) Transcript_3668:1035-1943(-)